MVEKKDWRLLNDVWHLKGQSINPTDSEELHIHMPQLKHCAFCWCEMKDTFPHHTRWYLPLDRSCCICEACFQDFKEMFDWKLLDGWDIEWF